MATSACDPAWDHFRKIRMEAGPHVFAGVRLPRGEPFPTAATRHNTALAQLVINPPALRHSHGGGAAHHTARPMAGAAERLLHAGLLAGEHPTRAAHVAGNE